MPNYDIRHSINVRGHPFMTSALEGGEGVPQKADKCGQGGRGGSGQFGRPFIPCELNPKKEANIPSTVTLWSLDLSLLFASFFGNFLTSTITKGKLL